MGAARLAAAGLFAALVATFAPVVAAQEPVRVGFRSDTPPFSFRTEDGAPFAGFLVELCEDALADAGLAIEAVHVTAEDRFERLGTGGARGGVDMLCDPTSIRPTNFDRFILSPQVFATGVGYLQHQRGAAGDPIPADVPDVRVGFRDGTTARLAVWIGETLKLIAPRESKVTPGRVVRTAYASHREGIEAVCSGAEEFYFGDLDILRRVRADVTADGVPCDGVADSGTRTFSYEAYALAVSPARPDVALAVQAGLFRLFSDGRADAAFQKHFERPRSAALQAVFSLNRVLPPCHLVEAYNAEAGDAAVECVTAAEAR